MTLLCLLVAEREVRAGMPAPASWLSPSEQARLQSLGSAARRGSFLAGRWLARLAVQRWLGCERPPALDLADSGACRVAGREDVFVSISHSAGHIACAAAGLPVGVDIEDLARPRDHLALAANVHSPAQQAELGALPAEARAPVFLSAWTMKEAWLKARGRGLDFALMRALDFDADPRGDVAVATLAGLVLALAGDPRLPARIDGPADALWRRYSTRNPAA